MEIVQPAGSGVGHEGTVPGARWDAFHATFGPAGADGYPAKLWDAETGAMDPEVARYWREH